MEKLVKVVIGVLLRQQRQGVVLLVAKRPDQAVLGGLWEFPGGKVEPGEQHQLALQREFHEELGIAIEVGRPLAPIVHRYEHACVHLHPYWCSAPADAQPRNLALAGHRWVTPAELPHLPMPAANASLVKQIIQTLDATDVPMLTRDDLPADHSSSHA